MALTLDEALELKKLQVEAERLLSEAEAEADRKEILATVEGCGRVSGSNDLNLLHGRYPWHNIQNRMAQFWARPISKPKGVKLVSVARGHLKTEVGCHAMARHILQNPESRNGIIGATSDRGQANLQNIIGILQKPRFMRAFQNVIPPAGSQRTAFTSTELTLTRQGAYREPTIKVGGLESNWTGVHFGLGSILWLDDPVNKQNSTTPELRRKTYEQVESIIHAVADPGCQIVITYTRYAHDDAYSYFLAQDSDWTPYLEPGAINVGCWVVNDEGALEPVYPLRYCIEPKQIKQRVEYRGKRYMPVRESLLQKKAMMTPAEWNSQWMNNPQPDDAVIFRQEYFRGLLPCEGKDLQTFLGSQENVKEHLTKNEKELNRGRLMSAILCDPSYGSKKQNDFQVAAVVFQDGWGHWYIADAYHARLGTTGLEKLIRLLLQWQRQYFVTLPWGIETHSREPLIPLIKQFAREEGMTVDLASLKLNTNQGKESRYGALEPLFRNGMVHWCQNTKWFQDLARAEMCQFGGGMKHDDIGDCLSNGLQVFPPRHGFKAWNPVDLNPDREFVVGAW